MGLKEDRLLLGICILFWISDSSLALGASSFVTQFPSEVSSIKGDNVTLRCTFSISAGQATSAKRAMSWFKGLREAESVVVPGPRFSLIYPDTFLNAGEGLLVITNVSLEDAGIYTCQVILWSEGEMRGNGAHLHVYARPSHPVIFLQLQTSPESKWTLLCSTKGFFPDVVVLTWYRLGEKLPSSQQGYTDLGGSLQASSSLVLPNPDQRASYVCSVEHPSLADPLRAQYCYEPYLQIDPSLVRVFNLLKIVTILAITTGFFTAGPVIFFSPNAAASAHWGSQSTSYYPANGMGSEYDIAGFGYTMTGGGQSEKERRELCRKPQKYAFIVAESIRADLW